MSSSGPPKKRRSGSPASRRGTGRGSGPSSSRPLPGGGPSDPEAAAGVARTFLSIFVFLVLGALSAAAALYPSRHREGTGTYREFPVVAGEPIEAMAGRLETEGLVENRHLFALYMRVTGGAAHLVEGSHFLSDDLSPLELRRRLERSSWGTRARVTLPEGWTRFDMARRFEAQGVCTLRAFLDATKDPRLLAELRIEGVSAEGYLFPATYDFLKDSDATDVVRRMKVEFDRRYDAVADKNLPAVGALSDELGWSTKQFVILASMVEKEARVDEERSTVAGVFVNRLKDPNFRPKLLQCDPTAAYGCLDNPTQAPSCANYTGKVTHDIVADPENIYNTYKHEGLPPGPISNPGAKSLEAALFPANTRYLYFVARGDGHHTFSETYSAHTQAIKGAKGQGEPRGRPSP